MKKVEFLSLCLSVFLIITFATGGLFLTNFNTFVQAQSPPQTINGQIIVPLDVADSIFNENTTTFLGSKNISLTPYRMTEEHYFEHGILKGVGNLTNNQTFFNTYLSDDLLIGRGNGTMETSDGQKITWISSDLGKLRGNQWVYYGVMQFNNTGSESFSLLNNSIALSKSSYPLMEPEYIWLLEK